ncbi:MAG: hypothetical protein VW600_00295 [Ferrovibrio sp.]
MPSSIYAIPYGVKAPQPAAAQMAAASGSAVAASGSEQGAKAEKGGNPLFGKDGFTFSDFLDIINPLQHIPIVNTVYRAITGDKIDPGSRIVGGGLFGGPIGLVVSLVSGAVEEATGKDPGEHALAALGIDLGPGKKDQPQTMLADAAKPAEAMPAALAADVAAKPAEPEMKLGIRIDEPTDRKTNQAPRGRPVASSSGGAVELPADLFQALKQTAASQQADTQGTAINNARANSLPGQQSQARQAGPMQVNATPSSPVQGADGRIWFPAFPTGGGGAPSRAVGTSPVSQDTGVAKFGVARGNNFGATPQAATAAAAAAIQQERQGEWSNRAADAYQKYFDMQNEKNRRAGIVP